MFCSDLQLKYYIPTQFCDLESLLLIACYLVYREIPATRYARALTTQNPGTNFFEPIMYKKLRLANSRHFEKELCSKSNPFTKMVCYLYKKRDYLHKVAKKAAEK
jgi:hypothetical protein